MIIAEIGQNFDGCFELAKELIQLAKDNGADKVKFQLYDTEALYAPDAPTRQQAWESELDKRQASYLFNYGREVVGIEVFFSVFDIERVEWCESMGVERYKVAYSQKGNMELAKAIYATCKPAMISSNGIHEVFSNDTKDLYCVPKYPAELSDVDVDYAGNFEGFSDHFVGLDMSKIFLAMGAEIIEKHFAVDHETGVDAPWSMTPQELKELKRWEQVCKKIL